jgi:hypothetical protein
MFEFVRVRVCACSSLQSTITMARRSERNVGKKVNYGNIEMSLFPDGPPTTPIEHTFHSLNMKAFPHSSYALVDNIVVHARFSTKRRAHSTRAFLLQTTGDHTHLEKKDSLKICEIINSKIDPNYPTHAECETAAMDIQSHLHWLLTKEHIPILQQCVVKSYPLCVNTK